MHTAADTKIFRSAGSGRELVSPSEISTIQLITSLPQSLSLAAGAGAGYGYGNLLCLHPPAAVSAVPSSSCFAQPSNRSGSKNARNTDNIIIRGNSGAPSATVSLHAHATLGAGAAVTETPAMRRRRCRKAFDAFFSPSVARVIANRASQNCIRKTAAAGALMDGDDDAHCTQEESEIALCGESENRYRNDLCSGTTGVRAVSSAIHCAAKYAEGHLQCEMMSSEGTPDSDDFVDVLRDELHTLLKRARTAVASESHTQAQLLDVLVKSIVPPQQGPNPHQREGRNGATTNTLTTAEKLLYVILRTSVLANLESGEEESSDTAAGATVVADLDTSTDSLVAQKIRRDGGVTGEQSYDGKIYRKTPRCYVHSTLVDKRYASSSATSAALASSRKLPYHPHLWLAPSTIDLAEHSPSLQCALRWSADVEPVVDSTVASCGGGGFSGARAAGVYEELGKAARHWSGPESSQMQLLDRPLFESRRLVHDTVAVRGRGTSAARSSSASPGRCRSAARLGGTPACCGASWQWAEDDAVCRLFESTTRGDGEEEEEDREANNTSHHNTSNINNSSLVSTPLSLLQYKRHSTRDRAVMDDTALSSSQQQREKNYVPFFSMFSSGYSSDTCTVVYVALHASVLGMCDPYLLTQLGPEGSEEYQQLKKDGRENIGDRPYRYYDVDSLGVGGTAASRGTVRHGGRKRGATTNTPAAGAGGTGTTTTSSRAHRAPYLRVSDEFLRQVDSSSSSPSAVGGNATRNAEKLEDEEAQMASSPIIRKKAKAEQSATASTTAAAADLGRGVVSAAASHSLEHQPQKGQYARKYTRALLSVLQWGCECGTLFLRLERLVAVSERNEHRPGLGSYGQCALAALRASLAVLRQVVCALTERHGGWHGVTFTELLRAQEQLRAIRAQVETLAEVFLVTEQPNWDPVAALQSLSSAALLSSLYTHFSARMTNSLGVYKCVASGAVRRLLCVTVGSNDREASCSTDESEGDAGEGDTGAAAEGKERKRDVNPLLTDPTLKSQLCSSLDAVGWIFAATLEPLDRMVRTWLTSGELVDPLDEFFIVPASATRGGFVLDTSLHRLPCFIAPAVAATILHAGISMRALRAAATHIITCSGKEMKRLGAPHGVLDDMDDAAGMNVDTETHLVARYDAITTNWLVKDFIESLVGQRNGGDFLPLPCVGVLARRGQLACWREYYDACNGVLLAAIEEELREAGQLPGQQDEKDASVEDGEQDVEEEQRILLGSSSRQPHGEHGEHPDENTIAAAASITADTGVSLTSILATVSNCTASSGQNAEGASSTDVASHMTVCLDSCSDTNVGSVHTLPMLTPAPRAKAAATITPTTTPTAAAASLSVLSPRLATRKGSIASATLPPEAIVLRRRLAASTAVASTRLSVVTTSLYGAIKEELKQVVSVLQTREAAKERSRRALRGEYEAKLAETRRAQRLVAWRAQRATLQVARTRALQRTVDELRTLYYLSDHEGEEEEEAQKIKPPAESEGALVKTLIRGCPIVIPLKTLPPVPANPPVVLYGVQEMDETRGGGGGEVALAVSGGPTVRFKDTLISGHSVSRYDERANTQGNAVSGNSGRQHYHLTQANSTLCSVGTTSRSVTTPNSMPVSLRGGRARDLTGGSSLAYSPRRNSVTALLTSFSEGLGSLTTMGASTAPATGKGALSPRSPRVPARVQQQEREHYRPPLPQPVQVGHLSAEALRLLEAKSSHPVKLGAEEGEAEEEEDEKAGAAHVRCDDEGFPHPDYLYEIADINDDEFLAKRVGPRSGAAAFRAGWDELASKLKEQQQHMQRISVDSAAYLAHCAIIGRALLGEKPDEGKEDQEEIAFAASFSDCGEDIHLGVRDARRGVQLHSAWCGIDPRETPAFFPKTESHEDERDDEEDGEKAEECGMRACLAAVARSLTTTADGTRILLHIPRLTLTQAALLNTCARYYTVVSQYAASYLTHKALQIALLPPYGSLFRITTQLLDVCLMQSEPRAARMVSAWGDHVTDALDAFSTSTQEEHSSRHCLVDSEATLEVLSSAFQREWVECVVRGTDTIPVKLVLESDENREASLVLVRSYQQQRCALKMAREKHVVRRDSPRNLSMLQFLAELRFCIGKAGEEGATAAYGSEGGAAPADGGMWQLLPDGALSAYCDIYSTLLLWKTAELLVTRLWRAGMDFGIAEAFLLCTSARHIIALLQHHLWDNVCARATAYRRSMQFEAGVLYTYSHLGEFTADHARFVTACGTAAMTTPVFASCRAHVYELISEIEDSEHVVHMASRAVELVRLRTAADIQTLMHYRQEERENVEDAMQRRRMYHDPYSGEYDNDGAEVHDEESDEEEGTMEQKTSDIETDNEARSEEEEGDKQLPALFIDDGNEGVGPEESGNAIEKKKLKRQKKKKKRAVQPSAGARPTSGASKQRILAGTITVPATSASATTKKKRTKNRSRGATAEATVRPPSQQQQQQQQRTSLFFAALASPRYTGRTRVVTTTSAAKRRKGSVSPAHAGRDMSSKTRACRSPLPPPCEYVGQVPASAHGVPAVFKGAASRHKQEREEREREEHEAEEALLAERRRQAEKEVGEERERQRRFVRDAVVRKLRAMCTHTEGLIDDLTQVRDDMSCTASDEVIENCKEITGCSVLPAQRVSELRRQTGQQVAGLSALISGLQNALNTMNSAW